MKTFYQKTTELDQLKQLVSPKKKSFNKAKELMGEVLELNRYFYDKNDQGSLSVKWLELLDGEGEFDSLAKEEAEIIERLKAIYLVDCAGEKAETVLKIIEKVKAKDLWIQGKLTEAILQMPEDIAKQGIPIISDYLKGKESKVWFFAGEVAAKLMVKLKDKYTGDAFKIAQELADAWEATDEYKLKEMIAKFEEHDYEELIFKYYNKLFEVDAFKATGILAKILERYVKEASERDDYDVSSLFYIRMENLEEIDRRMAGIVGILVKGICEGGRAVIDKQPEKVKELLDYLEGLDKAIFYRIEMYLLRHMPKEVESERINRIIASKKFLEEPGYEYEYKLLLRDKFDELDEKTVSGFIEWVKNIKKSEEDRKEIEEWCKKNNEKVPNFEKMENHQRAEELYLVRDKFKDIYQEYVKKAGVDDESKLAPRRMVGEARCVSPMEGTPLQPEEMTKKKVDEVLDFILEPKNYEDKKKPDEWRDPVDALRSTFKEDVKKRPKEYLGCDIAKLKAIPTSFLASLFYGIEDAVREGSFNKQEWELLIRFASLVVEEKHTDQEYRDCFSEILSVLREGFGGGKGKLELDEPAAKKFWGILKKLIYFPVKNIDDRDEERDPVQLTLRHVAGKALGLTVLLGLTCKKRYSKYWGKKLKTEMREYWEYVLKSITEPGINCVFGIEFSRMYWLDTEWIEKNLDLIFKDELWDEVWGTYTSWGRPSPNGFKLLVERGIYERAVEKLGQANQFKFQKNPEDGLVEHLMIGYFNGWVGLEDSALVRFFEVATAKLRGKAARFLTTGFKGIKEDKKPYEDIAERMRKYWKSRLEALKENPQDKTEEAVEFTGWVEDSLLPGKETLELLEQSLDLSGGKIGRMRDARDFVEGVSKLGKGNELLALRCLKKAAADENMHMAWSGIQDPLVNFLETMVDLPKDVRGEAKEVADAYGRFHPGKFRSVWERLSKEVKR